MVVVIQKEILIVSGFRSDQPKCETKIWEKVLNATAVFTLPWPPRRRTTSQCRVLHRPYRTDCSRVDRAALFTAAEPSSVSAKLNPLASIQQFFDLKKDVKTQTDVNDTAADAFNLFSTSSAPAKISLDEATYEVPLVNRKRPHECYFTSQFFPLVTAFLISVMTKNDSPNSTPSQSAALKSLKCQLDRGYAEIPLRTLI